MTFKTISLAWAYFCIFAPSLRAADSATVAFCIFAPSLLAADSATVASLELTNQNLSSISLAEIQAAQEITLESKEVYQEFVKKVIEPKLINKINVLNVMNCSLDDQDLQKIAPLAISTLFLGGNKGITDNGIRHLHHMTSLIFIGLKETQITVIGLRDLLNRFSNLTQIGLTECKQIASGEFRELGGHERLTRIDLGDTNVSDDDLLEISKLTNLTQLLLPSTKITDVGGKAIGKLKKLRTLDLADTAITNETICGLSTVSLEKFSADFTKIADECVETLLRQPLEILSIIGTQFSESCVNQLKKHCKKTTHTFCDLIEMVNGSPEEDG